MIDPENEDSTFFDEFIGVIDNVRLRHADDKYAATETEVTTDPDVGMEMALVRGGEGKLIHAIACKRVRDHDGKPVGVAHSNPRLDSRKYEVQNVDGHVEELTANLIAENLIAQVDEEGRRQMMLSAIIDHRTLHDAIPQSRGTYVNTYGVQRRKTTTKDYDAWMGTPG